MAILCTKSLFEQLHNREAREQQESWCAHATSWLKVPGHASAVSVLWRCSPQTASGPVTGACAHHMGDYLFLAGYELICEPCPFSDNRGEKMYFPFCRASYPQNNLSGLVTHLGEVFMDFASLPAHSLASGATAQRTVREQPRAWLGLGEVPAQPLAPL